MNCKKLFFTAAIALSCMLFTLVADVQAAEPTEGLHTVDENSLFRFDYDETGADIFITDKRTGKVWSNTVDPEYYKEELANWNVMSQLMTVSYAKESGNITMVNVFDNGATSSSYDLTCKYDNKALVLQISLNKGSITFEVRMWLDETGFNYEIPWDTVKETGKDMLVNIQMMPTFGAAVAGEKGYTFVPDGSGTIVEYKTYDSPNARLYTFPFYGTDVLDIKTIQEEEEKGYQGLMLPVYGISHHDGAVLAAVTQGASDSALNLAPSGFKFKGLNRAYLTFYYRIYVSEKIYGEENIIILPYVNDSDRAVKMFLLDEEHNTYSDMAVAYRGYLEKEGILKAQMASQKVPMVVDLVMGANESSLFGSKLIAATTYTQAAEIAQKLSGRVPELSIRLQGWGKGGYDTYPTNPKLERKFGGKKGWNQLLKTCEEENVKLYLNMDFVNANKETGDFNNRKDTIRSGYGSIVAYKENYLLNAVTVLNNLFQNAVNQLKFGRSESISFDMVGKLLTYDFNKANPTSRTKAQLAYEKVLQEANKQMEDIAVTGGNQYVLPYATLLNDIPQSNSDYYFADDCVPFYQIVVHGSVAYTSTAGNHSYDLQYQKLKWIETGSVPYFVITYESPVVLNKTSYNDLFSSQFSVWENEMAEISTEFNDKLKDIWNLKIQKHEERDGSVVVTYEDNTRIYLNYSSVNVQVDGLDIPSMDYVIVRGE